MLRCGSRLDQSVGNRQPRSSAIAGIRGQVVRQGRDREPANPDHRPSEAFEVMDGDSGMGFLVGHHAMGRAMELAGTYGIGAVATRNSNHFGAAALYAKQATDAGLLALAMTNVKPNLVVSGWLGADYRQQSPGVRGPDEARVPVSAGHIHVIRCRREAVAGHR